MVWPHTEVCRSTPEAETLLCSKPRHPQSWLRALQPSRGCGLQKPLCSRKSLGFVGERAGILHAGAHHPVSPHSRVCFQHILPKWILAPGTAPEISCHFTALQLPMFISVPSANLPEHSSSFDTCCICVWLQHHSDALAFHNV